MGKIVFWKNHFISSAGPCEAKAGKLVKEASGIAELVRPDLRSMDQKNYHHLGQRQTYKPLGPIGELNQSLSGGRAP